MKKLLFLITLAMGFSGCVRTQVRLVEVKEPNAQNVIPHAQEKHFKSLKQLTFQGTNAEAYFSPNDQKIIYQGHNQKTQCDQMYLMNRDGSDKQLLHNQGGRNTCGYFVSENEVVFSSTLADSAECPRPSPLAKNRYVWEIYSGYEIYRKNLKSGELVNLSQSNGYDAETTACRNNLVFTSARSNQSIDIYLSDLRLERVKKLNDKIGYSGGAVFSPDCSKVVFRAYYPKTAQELADFKKAFKDLVIPSGPLEIYLKDLVAKKNSIKPLTQLGVSSFAPTFFIKEEAVLFSSNLGATPRDFHLFKTSGFKEKQTKVDLTQITFGGTFNGFPMFSSDQKYLLFASNRNSKNPRELNVFLAEWQD